MAFSVLIARTGYKSISLSVGKYLLIRRLTENRLPTMPEFQFCLLWIHLTSTSLSVKIGKKEGKGYGTRGFLFDILDLIYGKEIDYDESRGPSEFFATSDGDFEVAPVIRVTGRPRKKIRTKGFRPYRLENMQTKKRTGMETAVSTSRPFSEAPGGEAVNLLLQMEKLLKGLGEDLAAEEAHFKQNT